MSNSTYRQKLKRYVTANYNEVPDRIPIRLFAEEFSAKWCGYDNYEPAVRPELQFDINRQLAVETGIDAIQTNSVVNWFVMQKALGWEGITFPGIGLSADSVNQWGEPTTDEAAFLKASEYGEFAEDPTAFLVSKWLPRFTRHINPVGEPVTYEHNMSFINGMMAYNHFFSMWGAKTGELIEAGVVPAVSSVLKAPLDILGDKLRGYVNLCYDLHERRDEVIKTCEALMPHLFNLVLGGADPDRNIPSIIWMHRGTVPFISHKDFTDIYWATLRPIIEELWAHGQQIILYAEGNWDSHLDEIAALPEKSIIFHCDKTNVKLAHQKLGKKFAISGGVPNEMLIFATPQEIKDTCKDLIASVAQEGGFIMDTSALIMSDAKVENVQALIDATREFGDYPASLVSQKSLEELKDIPHATPKGIPYVPQKRKPGVCIPWEEKRKELPPFTVDETLARQEWEKVDGMGYGFCWVNLTW